MQIGKIEVSEVHAKTNKGNWNSNFNGTVVHFTNSVLWRKYHTKKWTEDSKKEQMTAVKLEI